MNYQFLEFKLESLSFKLLRSEEQIDVEPQVFNVLLYLLENRDRIVSRDELLENLWSGKEVLDSTISNHIKIARSILGDNGERQSVIKTVRGRGYQFVEKVTIIDEIIDTDLTLKKGDEKSLFHKSNIIYLLLLLIPIIYSIYYYMLHADVSNINKPQDSSIATKQSIAILPFQNRSNREEDQSFADGFHDDLLTQVSKIEQLKTISRTSVMQYRNTNKNIRTIAKELGVTTILEGGVQRSGEKIRINIQLIDAINDQHIWAETFTRELNVKNIFIIQSEISARIASSLKLALEPSFNKLPTQNMIALEYYFKAKHNILNGNGSASANKKAITNLEAALIIDPEFPNAIAELASRYLDQISLEGKPKEIQIALSKPLILKAKKLNSTSSEIFRVDAKLEMYQENFYAAKMSYTRSIALNPNNAEAIGAFAKYHMYKGRIDKAVELLFDATTLSPKDNNLKLDLALMLTRNSRFLESEAILNDILLKNPNNAYAHQIMADYLFFGKHDISQSIIILHNSLLLDSSLVNAPLLIADRYIDLGDKINAIKWLKYSIRTTQGSRIKNHSTAKLYLLENQKEKAFEQYLRLSEFDPQYLYDLLVIGQSLNRLPEALNQTKKLSPELFEKKAIIGSRNMSTAFALARILKTQGEKTQAKYLLENSLKIAKRKANGGLQSQSLNWETRILLAMGDKKSAIKSFEKYVNEGFYSNFIISHSDYKILQNDINYIKLIKIMKDKINIERHELSESSEELKLATTTLYLP